MSQVFQMSTLSPNVCLRVEMANNAVRTLVGHVGNIGGDGILSCFLSPNSDLSRMDLFSLLIFYEVKQKSFRR